MSHEDPAQHGTTRKDVTLVLRAVSDGAVERRSELFDLLYAELRSIATAHLRHERQDHTLQATALVHEAWVKLVDQEAPPSGGHNHFLSVASQAMRRILVDHARGKHRAKRGGGMQRVELVDDNVAGDADSAIDLVELDEVLRALEQESPRQAQLIELRFFGGLSAAESASVLNISLSTAEREWRVARAWLLSRLQD